jgi:hypothetical protein
MVFAAPEKYINMNQQIFLMTLKNNQLIISKTMINYLLTFNIVQQLIKQKVQFKHLKVGLIFDWSMMVHQSEGLLIDEKVGVAAMQSGLAYLHKMQGTGVECFMVVLNLVELINTQFFFFF